MKTSNMNEFVISRTFEAPRERVWKAWTNPEDMKQWWGPKGSTILDCKIDLRLGGTCQYRMQYNNQDMWGKFVYREIVRPERLVFVTSFSDENGGVTRHPLSPTWPLEMLSKLTLSERAGRTALKIEWVPISPTDEERKTFETGQDSMQKGWTGTLDKLTEYVKKAES
jgi:uncharacterized protein YndB with AHSA1/START domain